MLTIDVLIVFVKGSLYELRLKHLETLRFNVWIEARYSELDLQPLFKYEAKLA